MNNRISYTNQRSYSLYASVLRKKTGEWGLVNKPKSALIICPKRATSNSSFASSSILSRTNAPMFALTIGTVALCFQVMVLYPWHHELSRQIDALQVIL